MILFEAFYEAALEKSNGIQGQAQIYSRGRNRWGVFHEAAYLNEEPPLTFPDDFQAHDLEIQISGLSLSFIKLLSLDNTNG